VDGAGTFAVPLSPANARMPRLFAILPEWNHILATLVEE
jgi:hypothetical protein